MGPDAFDFELPPEQIAQGPAPDRGGSRMLVLGSTIDHARVQQLPARLPEGALVVVNESKVVPARLRMVRDDGRRFELLMCAPGPGQGPGTSVCAWVRNARKLREGDCLEGGGLALQLVGADAVDPRARRFKVVRGDVLGACHTVGDLPLPPYISRPHGPEPQDASRYQTVFAAEEGSVAAPTAGLHLDPTVVEDLDPVRVTLHVGPGTFLPMEATDVRDHRVGAERFCVSPRSAARIRAAQQEGRPIVAVGTTVTRTLETLGQGGRLIEPAEGWTDLVITPGHRFGVVTHLLTNFHLPRSSLLMLVCSLGGRTRVLNAYGEAVRRGYRFYSYGDCMLVCAEGKSR